jgi:hypothetical protein
VIDSIQRVRERKSDSLWYERHQGRIYKVAEIGFGTVSGIADPENRHGGNGLAASLGLGRVTGPGLMVGGRLSGQHHSRTDYNYAWNQDPNNPYCCSSYETIYNERYSFEPQVELTRFYQGSGHMWRAGVGGAYYSYKRGGPDPLFDRSMGLSGAVGYNYVFAAGASVRMMLGIRLAGMYYYDGTTAMSWTYTLGLLNL